VPTAGNLWSPEASRSEGCKPQWEEWLSWKEPTEPVRNAGQAFSPWMRNEDYCREA